MRLILQVWRLLYFQINSQFSRSQISLRPYHSFIRYEVNLGLAKAYGMRKGMVAGAMMGLVFFIIFAVDGLAFWYGSKLVRDEPKNYTAGSMLIVSKHVPHSRTS